GDYARELDGNALIETCLPPAATLASAAAGWGSDRILPDPADGVIRRLDIGSEQFPSVSLRAGQVLKGDAVLRVRERGQVVWLNYYGPRAAFRAVDLDQVLATNGVMSGFFRDKLVVVGTRSGPQPTGAAADQFATPYGRSWWRYSSGAGIHALSLLN